MPSEQALASLKEDKIKPRKTSYDGMSTWMFLKQQHQKKQHLHTDLNPKYPFESLSNLSWDGDSHKHEEPRTELFQRSDLAKDYLMRNWSLRRSNENTFDKTWSRYGRSGGVWNNVKESLKGDGNRFLFINGAAKTNENFKKFKSSSTNNLGYLSNNFSENINEPRPKEKLDIHTKLAVEKEHWNIVR